MPRTIPIEGTTKAFDDNRVFVAVDIGKNFIQTKEEQSVETYLKNAKELVDEAVAAGADAVKFQTHEVEDEQLNLDIVSPHFTGADRYSWVTRNTEMTPLSFWHEIKRHCDERGVIFFSTPMSRKAAMKLDQVGVPFWKVGSGDVRDYVCMNYLIRTGKPIVIATGMVSHEELDRVVRYVTGFHEKLIILYCISQYPCPTEMFNLASMVKMKEKYPNLHIGFSDHSIGYDVDLAAAKLGATMIEKHFSLSRELWGADHKVSMTPEELRGMVKALRDPERMAAVDPVPYLGDPEAELEGAQNKFRPLFNKALMAGADIRAGTVITEEMVFAMRPIQYAGGLPSDRLADVVGKPAAQDIKKYDPLNAETVKL